VLTHQPVEIDSRRGKPLFEDGATLEQAVSGQGGQVAVPHLCCPPAQDTGVLVAGFIGVMGEDGLKIVLYSLSKRMGFCPVGKVTPGP
jgi:hypothetical protein